MILHVIFRDNFWDNNFFRLYSSALTVRFVDMTWLPLSQSYHNQLSWWLLVASLPNPVSIFEYLLPSVFPFPFSSYISLTPWSDGVYPTLCLCLFRLLCSSILLCPDIIYWVPQSLFLDPFFTLLSPNRPDKWSWLSLLPINRDIHLYIS